MVQKESLGSKQDRRTSLELAIVVRSMRKARAGIRWVPHAKKIVDCMTKADVDKGNDALLQMLRSGTLQ